MAATPSASSCGRYVKAEGKDASLYQPAPPRRPGQMAPGGRRATAQSHGGAGRSRYTIPYRDRFRRQAWSSSLRAWRCGTTAGRRAFPYVGSSSDTWRSAAGPMLCCAPTPRRNRCYCSGICCGGRSPHVKAERPMRSVDMDMIVKVTPEMQKRIAEFCTRRWASPNWPCSTPDLASGYDSEGNPGDAKTHCRVL